MKKPGGNISVEKFSDSSSDRTPLLLDVDVQKTEQFNNYIAMVAQVCMPLCNKYMKLVCVFVESF